MKKVELERAIKDEVDDWPHVSVEFANATGGGHPKAKLTYAPPDGDKLMMSVPYPSTPGDPIRGLQNCLAGMRRTMKQLGATRAKPEPTEADLEKRYSKPNDGAEKRPDPVQGEKATPKPTIAEQLADHPSTALVTVNQSIQVETEEPLGAGIWDIDEDRYHSDPCPQPSLSASIAKKMIEFSPYHAWHSHPRLNPAYEPVEKLIFRVGRAFHALLLGKGAPVEVFDYPDWRKDVAKADRDNCLANGGTPLLPHQFEEVEAMVRAAKRQIGRRQEVAFALAGGIPERVYIWVEETPSGPIFCRMMVDWTPHGGRFPLDFKTHGQGAEDWGQRGLWDTGFDIQDAFYRRGFKAVTGIEYDALIAVVIESKEPHAMMHHRVMPEDQAGADMEVRWAINAFAACLHKGRWPGYPTDMAWQSKPGWRAQRVEQRYEGSQRDLEALLANLEQMKEIAPRLEGAEVTDDNPFGLTQEPA